MWELKEITLRYCATSGSSEGVRSFVENGLISFSKRNPQIHFRTKIQGGHPCVFGSYSKLVPYSVFLLNADV